jgi:hypothetical protein
LGVGEQALLEQSSNENARLAAQHRHFNTARELSRETSSKAQELCGTDVSREKIKSLLAVDDDTLDEHASQMRDAHTQTMLSQRRRGLDRKREALEAQPKAQSILGVAQASSDKLCAVLGATASDLRNTRFADVSAVVEEEPNDALACGAKAPLLVVNNSQQVCVQSISAVKSSLLTECHHGKRQIHCITVLIEIAAWSDVCYWSVNLLGYVDNDNDDGDASLSKCLLLPNIVNTYTRARARDTSHRRFE